MCLEKIIEDKVNTLLISYDYSKSSAASEIFTIIITFIPHNQNFISRFKLNDPDELDINSNQIIGDDFSIKTITPVTVTTKFLGKELDCSVLNGRIVDVRYVDSSVSGNPLISLASEFENNPKLSKLSPKFKKFFIIYL